MTWLMPKVTKLQPQILDPLDPPVLTIVMLEKNPVPLYAESLYTLLLCNCYIKCDTVGHFLCVTMAMQ